MESREEKKIRRCAIYTRKSHEDGLEQNFNSLDAQRESAESYIASQRSEGWECLPDLYDDGGISGGTMERPALQRLLADVENGRVDIIVVYKAEQVRYIFERFLLFGSAKLVAIDINRQGFHTKSWTTAKGRVREDKPWNTAQVYRVLNNILYIGKVSHKGTL